MFRVPELWSRGWNLGVYHQNQLGFFTVEFAEKMPGGRQSIVDFGALAASASTARASENVLQLDKGHLYRLWMEPLDDVEVEVWVPGVPLWRTRRWQARATWFSDPADTEFGVIGADEDAEFVVANPRALAIARSRVKFFGQHYVLKALGSAPSHYTWFPAQGWSGAAGGAAA